ncbi:hypothetical protein GQ43DRAFT_453902 [Delitschia confertaspora ATCC 74209]|uniref:Protein kinase domain-containing protein n=1 Tax=Delitschia confertaspora ATCC 74209 TaxID=1513339 RepID=A0A9P4JTQ3_9PLEO|nr:hypothetical protein GQ43DRAFT_453902 [Delitschia confertaspora ATCC 74209]
MLSLTQMFLRLTAFVSLPSLAARPKSPGSITSLCLDAERMSSQPTLWDLIEKMLVQSVFDGDTKTFLPEGAFHNLITKDAIANELIMDPSEELVKWVYRKAKRAFTITLFSAMGGRNLRAAMELFKQCGFGDDNLPIDPDSKFCEWHNRGDCAHNCLLKPFHHKLWKGRNLYNFKEDQWKFLVPVFTEKQFKHNFSKYHILPFIEKGQIKKEGGFSEVYEYVIHAEHQKVIAVPYGHTARFAIKKLIKEAPENSPHDEYDQEAAALDKINKLSHNHIIPRIAAFTRGQNRYFMFQWADGGNLQDFWKDKPPPDLGARFVFDIIQQLRGLADALDHLHRFGPSDSDATSESFRHGDLKPENILRFLVSDGLGTWKIADMGLAKHHMSPTHVRDTLGVHGHAQTSTRYGTARYEPPEVFTKPLAARSRRYDVWSLGCIVMELVIWLLYGYDKIQEFLRERVECGSQQGQFFEGERRAGGDLTARLHPIVDKWMKKIMLDLESNPGGALGDLFHLVRTQLLVVELPPAPNFFLNVPQIAPAQGPRIQTGISQLNIEDKNRIFRSGAEQFREELDNILRRAMGGTNKSYLERTSDTYSRCIPPSVAPQVPKRASNTPPPRSPQFLAPPGAQPPVQSRSLMGIAHHTDYSHPPMDGIWEFKPDKEFSSRVLEILGLDAIPARQTKDYLCVKCRYLDFSQPGFYIRDEVSDLKESSTECCCCKMRYSICVKKGVENLKAVVFDRSESVIKLHGTGDPVFTIVGTRESMARNSTSHVRLGLPVLPKSGSESHFAIIKQWLAECDTHENHIKCRPGRDRLLPTRVVNIKKVGDEIFLQLYEPAALEYGDYVALSHRWGQRTHFYTTTSNIERHKQCIPFEDLPATFQDAVLTTHALGFRYLWIDSLCIIQGPGGDFHEQAKKMEDVYSSAFVVIAASRAKDHADGFLKDRPQRDWCMLPPSPISPDKSPLYLCENIDDFEQDVLKGELNRRGWVLQERALSHRTIYFTKSQTYWECGQGVRCETLTKMRNNEAGIIGDPRFPEVASASRGWRMVGFQSLYKQYSRLDFTLAEDRPMGIAGLEHRLIKAFNTCGGYGIFDSPGYFQRSLLWKRGKDEETMRRIVFYRDRRIFPPTWSWMAYEGGIDYMDPPFDKVHWETKNIASPWTSNVIISSDNSWHTGDDQKKAYLVGLACNFNSTSEANITLDIPNQSAGRELKCVILGRHKKSKQEEDRLHYVLVIGRTTSSKVIYERVGVGLMPARCIIDMPKIRVKIK